MFLGLKPAKQKPNVIPMELELQNFQLKLTCIIYKLAFDMDILFYFFLIINNFFSRINLFSTFCIMIVNSRSCFAFFFVSIFFFLFWLGLKLEEQNTKQFTCTLQNVYVCKIFTTKRLFSFSFNFEIRFS